MTNQKPIENDPKAVTNPSAEVAPKGDKPDQPSEAKRELTDEEIAAVMGGSGSHCSEEFP
jgi:hypothetical protein